MRLGRTRVYFSASVVAPPPELLVKSFVRGQNLESIPDFCSAFCAESESGFGSGVREMFVFCFPLVLLGVMLLQRCHCCFLYLPVAFPCCLRRFGAELIESELLTSF